MTEFEAKAIELLTKIHAALLDRSASRASASTTVPAGSLPTNLPGYGKSKGQPIAGASANDLAYYADGCRKSLADSSKAKWHDKERAMLAALEAEMQRQGGGSSASVPADGAPGSVDVPFAFIETRLDRP